MFDKVARSTGRWTPQSVQHAHIISTYVCVWLRMHALRAGHSNQRTQEVMLEDSARSDVRCSALTGCCRNFMVFLWFHGVKHKSLGSLRICSAIAVTAYSVSDLALPQWYKLSIWAANCVLRINVWSTHLVTLASQLQARPSLFAELLCVNAIIYSTRCGGCCSAVCFFSCQCGTGGVFRRVSAYNSQLQSGVTLKTLTVVLKSTGVIESCQEWSTSLAKGSEGVYNFGMLQKVVLIRGFTIYYIYIYTSSMMSLATHIQPLWLWHCSLFTMRKKQYQSTVTTIH